MDNLIIFCAKYLIFVMALVVGVFWLMKPSSTKLKLALTIVLAMFMAVIMAKLLSKFYYHPRPFAVQNIQPLVHHAADNSFPSEHATGAAALALSAYLFNRRLGVFLAITALFVAWGRVAADVHYAVDVAAGLLIGCLAAWLGYKLAIRFLQKKQPALKPAAKD